MAKARAVRAVELATAGNTYAAIATELGYSHRSTVHRIVRKELAARGAEGVDLLQAVEVARLDALQTGLWERAMAGDPSACTAVVRIIYQRVRLLGLAGTAGPVGQASGPQADFTGRTVVQPSPERADA